MEFLSSKYKDNVLQLKLQYKNKLIENEFQEFLEHKRIFYLQHFQEAILERFGFIRNAAIIKNHCSDDDSVFFIHSTGGMFSQIPHYYSIYCGRSRHPSTATKQPKFDSTNDFKSIRFEDKINYEVKRINNLRPNNSISLTIGTNTRNNSALKRSNSTHLKFYELNKANIKSCLSSPKFNDKQLHNFSIPCHSSMKTIENEMQDSKNSLKATSNNSTNNSNNNNVVEQASSIHHSSKIQILIDENVFIEKKEPFYARKSTFVGFYWSWNFMLGKRLRSQYTGDENFQVR